MVTWSKVSDGPLASRKRVNAAESSSNRAREPSGLSRGNELGKVSSSSGGSSLLPSSSSTTVALDAMMLARSDSVCCSDGDGAAMIDFPNCWIFDRSMERNRIEMLFNRTQRDYLRPRRGSRWAVSPSTCCSTRYIWRLKDKEYASVTLPREVNPSSSWKAKWCMDCRRKFQACATARNRSE